MYENDDVSNADPNYAYLVENNNAYQGSIENEKEFLCKGCQEKLENVIRNIPHGVYSMMEEYPSIVECSDNFAMIKFDGDIIRFTLSLRSSNPKTFEEYTK